MFFGLPYILLHCMLVFAARPRVSRAYHPETSPQQGISVSDSVGSGSDWSGRSDSSSAEDTSMWHCSASPVKVNWGKRDKRHWLNSVAESEYFSGLETQSPECYHLFLLLSSPLPPQVFLTYLIYLLLPVKILEVCSGKWDKSSRINSTVHTPFPIQDLAHTLSCIAVAIYRVNVCSWSHSLQTATPSCQKPGLGGFSCLRTGWVLLFLELLYQASLEGLTRVTAACNHCYLQGRIKVLDRCTW